MHAQHAAFFGALRLLFASRSGPSEAGLFLLIFSAAASFFSTKMVRLICIMGAPAAALSGVALGSCCDLGLSPVWRTLQGATPSEASSPLLRTYNSRVARLLRLCAFAALCQSGYPLAKDFYHEADQMARHSLSHPQIVSKDGSGEVVDDYREAYGWLREHTPADSRVMAWWDYGYQINAIAQRTTLADGNTWNHEHIALLGLCLSSPSNEAHLLVRCVSRRQSAITNGQRPARIGNCSLLAPPPPA